MIRFKGLVFWLWEAVISNSVNGSFNVSFQLVEGLFEVEVLFLFVDVGSTLTRFLLSMSFEVFAFRRSFVLIFVLGISSLLFPKPQTGHNFHGGLSLIGGCNFH